MDRSALDSSDHLRVRIDIFFIMSRSPKKGNSVSNEKEVETVVSSAFYYLLSESKKMTILRLFSDPMELVETPSMF